MTESAAVELQATLIEALSSSEDLTAIVDDRIYDEPPQDSPLPYVRLGAIEPLPRRSSCSAAQWITFGVEAHSRPASGRVEASRICGVVQAIFDQRTDLPIDGFRFVSLDWLTQTTDRASDGRTYYGITVFQALIEPA